MMAEATAENDPLSKPVYVTVWRDMAPKEKYGGRTSLRELAKAIETRHATSKDKLQWLKLAEFGDIPTPRGVLRHNENVKSISGLEADYDGGEYGVDWAINKAAKANVACLIYTSPSHTVDHPRWRVLAPFSDDMDPADRDHLMGRLNGAFGAVFAGESWVLAQSYYYGFVDGNEEAHRVELVDGEAIDTLDELDVLWQGKPNRQPRYDDGGKHHFASLAEHQPLNLESCFDDIKSGRSYHASMLAIAAHYVGSGYDADEVRSILRSAMEAVPSEMRDRRWVMRSSAKHIEPMLEWLTGKENRKLFRRYKEAEQAEEARKEEAQAKERKAESPSGRLILSGPEFVAGFKSPSYLVDGIIQRGYLYSLTARTGHGKTAVDMHISQCVALGKPLLNKRTKQGSVLFCAGENPDDIRARYIVLSESCNFDPADAPIHFINGVVDIEKSFQRIKADAETIPDLMLIVVDTAAAYFVGDDPNNNAQQVSFARLLRRLTIELPSRPAVIVNCHPVKNAAKDNIVPMGGSAFLNEVDGNLTLWKSTEDTTELHWQGKFRGPEFEPLSFKLVTVESAMVKDDEGRRMPSVVAKPIGEVEIAHSEAQAETDENVLLAIVANNQPLSLAALATKAGWTFPNGAPAKSKAQKILARLHDYRFVQKVRGSRFKATKEGRRELGLDDD